MRLNPLIAAAAFAAALPAVAQTVPNPDPAPQLPYDRGYDQPSARADAINAQEAPVTAGLNAAAGADAAGQVASGADANAQYQADRAAYLDALAAHDRAVDRADQRYVRQQLAYADAMRDWRAQVQACQHGHRRACDLPPPNVADYY